MPKMSIPTGAPSGTPGRALAIQQNGPLMHPKVPQTQSPVLKRNVDSPVRNVKLPPLPLSSKSGGSSNASPSPKLYRHPLDKEKINALVKSAYKEKSTDSVKVRFL